MVPENVHTPPTEAIGNSRGCGEGGGGEGFSKAKNFKEMYEGGGVHGGGMDIFWNHTLVHQTQYSPA